MLDDLLKAIPPDTIAHAIKSNPVVVLQTLQKFVAYRAFGDALDVSQQLALSNNLDELAPFFKSDNGKLATKQFLNAFVEFLDE